MKYYVIEVSTTASGTAKAITEKDDFISAKMLYHQVLASMMANANVIDGMCTIIDGTGRQMLEHTEHFIREAE